MLGLRCCVRAFSSCGKQGLLCCSARASHCGGFSCWGARALDAWASVVVARGLRSCGARALERRLSSCGTRAQLLRSMWDLPEPVSPALVGRLLTTALPGKPPIHSSILSLPPRKFLAELQWVVCWGGVSQEHPPPTVSIICWEDSQDSAQSGHS